ncbi:MAG: membrane protein insertase YidC [Flavobacteriales bacterium]|nr:membrane protein insertase YidC [Flavobacteriales bacterium]MBK6884559.1 membrane protein insertase YidC [Flavobacteriales bacterium]MBK7100960.1 membrane protein insertase YidC [Flavobacteriales bacterium]MBK7111645.1 membrane protein insertase YidC [Flavobacteriales bacterium]MBK7483993.1 membrane protein insertase YidC [Flavobacteriales bacterium]
MDRNSIIGFILIAAILGGYTWYSMPTAEEQARMQRTQDSLATVAIERQGQEAEQALKTQPEKPADKLVAAPVLAEGDTVATDSLLMAARDQRFGIFHPSATGTNKEVVIENDHLQVALSSHGAKPSVIRLKEYLTHVKTPLYLADPDSGNYEFKFIIGNQDISTNDLYFTAEKQGKDGVRFTAATTDPAKFLRITYTLDTTSYFMDVRAEVVGMDDEVDARNTVFNWELVGFANEKYRTGELQKCGVYYKYFSDSRQYLSESKEDEKKLEGRTNWIAFKQDFFTVALISAEGFAGNGSELAITPLEDVTHTKRYSAKLFFEKDRDAEANVAMKLYLGPNHYGTLRRTEIPEFDNIIDLGPYIFGWMNRWLVIPIFNFLDGWGWNYGIIILVLTVVIKLLLMPLTYKNFVSSAKMRVLKPEIDAITEKHKDGDALKKQQATMELYRKAGVNPASGCLPMLVQMPVLFAMFRFFPSSIELRQQSFLWADDLSTFDSIYSWSAQIPLISSMYGNHISLFTILMAASTMVYTAINSNQMPTQQGMPNMKVMMYLFPVMMLFFMNSLPAGLSYYYLLANLISILQMTAFKSLFVNEDKIRMQLLTNMKTPKKKSKWQQRLDDMQKQQQASRKR